MRDYYLVFPNVMVRTANAMSSSALPLLMIALALPVAQVGWVVSMTGCMSMFTNLLGGVASDLVDRRRLMLVGVGVVVMATTLLGHVRTSASFAGLRVLQGLGSGIFRPAAQSLAYDLNPLRRAYVLGVLEGSYVLGNALGPALGGYVAEAHGLSTCMSLAGALALSAAAYLALMKHHVAGAVGPHRGLREHASGLLRASHGRLLAPLLVVLMDASILSVCLVYMPIYLRLRMHLSYTHIGLLMALEGLAYVVCQPLASRLMTRCGPRLPIALSVLCHGLLVASIPCIQEVWWIACCLALAGATNSAAHPGSVLLTAQLAAEHERGSRLGLLSSASNLGQWLGPVVGGALVATGGVLELPIYACVVPALVGAIAPCWASRDAACTTAASAQPALAEGALS